MVQNIPALEQGSIQQVLGTSDYLLNYEPSLNGGYERIKGYQKFSETQVPGLSGAKISGCGIANDGVYVSRENADSTSIDVYFGTGSTWTKVNDDDLSTASGRHRYLPFSITEEVMVITTGQEPAHLFDQNQNISIINNPAPAAPKYAEVINGRLALAPASNPSSIALSAPGDETDFSGGSSAVEIDVGDTVTGLKRFRDVLYIFCRNTIWRLAGTTTADFAIVGVSRAIGCVSHDSIQEVGGDLIFLSQDGLRSLAATERIGDVDLGLVSRQIQPFLNEFSANATEANITSCIVPSKSQYRMFMNDGSVTDDDNVQGVLGRLVAERSYEWAILEGFNATCCASAYFSTGVENVVFGHANDGYIYKMESGNDFDGRAVKYIYETPDLVISDSLFRKILQRLTVYTQLSGDAQIGVQCLLDFNEENVLQPATKVLSFTGSQALYGTAVYGTDTYSSITFKVFKRNLVGSCFQVKFKFSGQNIEAPHRIDALELQYLQKQQR
jgi:hypothetical protein